MRVFEEPGPREIYAAFRGLGVPKMVGPNIPALPGLRATSITLDDMHRAAFFNLDLREGME